MRENMYPVYVAYGVVFILPRIHMRTHGSYMRGSGQVREAAKIPAFVFTSKFGSEEIFFILVAKSFEEKKFSR